MAAEPHYVTDPSNGRLTLVPDPGPIPTLNSDRDHSILNPHFPAIPYSRFPEQPWLTVKPELGQPIQLINAPTPWTMVFDFSTFDGSDLVKLTIESLFYNDGNPEHGRWVLTDQHEVTIDQSHGPGKSQLTVDGNSVGRSRVLTVSPLAGPWVARLTYQHERSMTKPVRYMLLDLDKYPQR